MMIESALKVEMLERHRLLEVLEQRKALLLAVVQELQVLPNALICLSILIGLSLSCGIQIQPPEESFIRFKRLGPSLSSGHTWSRSRNF